MPTESWESSARRWVIYRFEEDNDEPVRLEGEYTSEKDAQETADYLSRQKESRRRGYDFEVVERVA